MPPHAASMSLTVLVRVRNSTRLPVFGLSLTASYSRPAHNSVPGGAPGGVPGAADLAAESALAPLLAPRCEAWLTARVPLSHDLFLSSDGAGGAIPMGDGRALVVLSLLWTGAAPSSSAPRPPPTRHQQPC